MMKTRDDILKYGLSLPGTYPDAPFHDDNWILVRRRDNNKAFLWTYEYQGRLQMNVKVDPEWRETWIGAFDAVLPAYHMNKKHWITIVIDGSMEDKEIKRFIAESYDLTKK